MPPKKLASKEAAKQETDLSDIASLPVLNDFVFVTLYAFKYTQNKTMMDQCLLAEFDLSSLGLADPETAEQAKRNRVIQLSDLINQARTANYLTPEELANNNAVDPLKLQQVLARCTNEILVSI